MNDFERSTNVTYPLIFRKTVQPGSSGVIEIELTGHGYITQVTAVFAAGESGTLHLRPYVELCGEINQELLKYAAEGHQFISGDDCSYKMPCYQEIENHAKAKLWYENTGTGSSEIMVDMIVCYDEIVQPRNIIG